MIKKLIEKLYVKYCGDIPEENFTVDEEVHLLEEVYLQNENFIPYLRYLMKRDKERYFHAPDKDKETIKGEYKRTKYLLKMSLVAEEYDNRGRVLADRNLKI